jgi:hypothetical protein
MVKFFGTTLKETLAAFKPIHLGSQQSEASKDDSIKAIGRIVVTLLLFLFSVYLLTNGINKDTANMIIGGIIGYWLK